MKHFRSDRTLQQKTSRALASGSTLSPPQIWGRPRASPAHRSPSSGRCGRCCQSRPSPLASMPQLHSPSSKPPQQAVAMREVSGRCLHMDYSFSHGHHGTRPCSSDHGEATRPVKPAVDRVTPFGTSFAMLASHGHASRHAGGGQAVVRLCAPECSP